MRLSTASIPIVAIVVGMASTGHVTSTRQTPSQSAPEAVSFEKARTARRGGYGALPLRFEANHGQTDASVDFVSRGLGYTVFLAASDAVIAVKRGDQRTAIRMRVAGAHPGSRAEPLDRLATNSHYFIGNDPAQWRTDVPNYARVRYPDVYKGVDLLYYGRDGELEYDFIVAPGADPRQVAFEMEGADRLEVAGDGDLHATLDGGVVTLHKPIVYQARRGAPPGADARDVVDARYVVDERHVVRFELGPYDPSRTLTIDPVLSYSTYLGGSGNDGGDDVAVDSAGNAYITGFTLSTNFPATAGSVDTSWNGGSGTSVIQGDAFIAKLTSGGTSFAYVTYLGGTSGDFGHAIAVDPSGNAYVAGGTNSPEFPTTAGAHRRNWGNYPFSSNGDGWLAKLNSTGSALVYSTFMGGTSLTRPYDLVVDASGNAYVTGHTFFDFITSDSTKLTTSTFHSPDAFVAQMNAAGSAFVYARLLGGSDYDEGHGIAIDLSGNAYVSGYTGSANFPTLNPIQAAYRGLGDLFVAKLNPTGSTIYATYLGGADIETPGGVAVDSSGSAYVTGMTSSTDYPTTAGAYRTVAPGNGDLFVSKINASGTALAYSTYLGGTGPEIVNAPAHGIAVDGAGNAYVTGGTCSTGFPVVNAVQPALAGVRSALICVGDAVLSKFNPSGSALLYSSYLGGSDGEDPRGLAIDAAGNAYITGYTHSSDYPTASAAFASRAGGSDVFVTKVSLGLAAPTITSISPPSGPIAGGTSVTITGTGFQTGATVAIGGASATSVSVGGPTTITAVAPPHAAGVHDLVVTNPDLQSATKSGAFTYTTSPGAFPVITAQPTSVTVAAGGSAQFAITANGTPAPTYQWQVSTTSGTTWTNLTDAAPYNGASTPILSFTNVSASLTGAQYRAIATNSAGTATSTAATLTVTAASGCSYTLGASGASFASLGGTGSVTVTASPSSCAWTAVSNASFITVTSGASGAGNGTVAYSVGVNYVTERFGSSPRSGTLSIAGQTFTVNQAGNQVCAFSLATSGVSMTASGGAGSVGVIANVTNSSGCSWTATSNASWLTITGGATSQAGGPVTFVAAPNTGLAIRTGTLSIASSTFTVTQAGTGPPLSADRTALTFGATTSGTSFTNNTSAQTVRLTQNSTERLSWSAAPTVPWLTVSPASGTGSATLTIGVRFDPSLPSSGTVTGSVVISLAGVSGTVGPVSVSLTLASPGASAGPFGVLDTPVGDATVLAGSVAVTGWTLDNVGVQRVELWRDLLPGETTPPFASTPTDPRNGKVFIGNPTFVDGARPDVEALHPTVPFKYRAGWGYLLLTRGLWNQGNGTYSLYAYAFDQEDNFATIGKKTIVVNNSAAAKPFGSIDSPAIGGDASGPNFGWALTPNVNGVATCKIGPNGVQVSIDSGPLQPVLYGGARTDIAGAFPGFSNTAAAGGHYIFDWSTLANGPHTIGWLITDDCNRADGVGSRFFNVTSGTSLTAGGTDAARALVAPSLLSGAFRANEAESAEPITVARGYGELPHIVTPGEAGSRIVDVKQGERIEVRLPHGYDTAYQVVNGGLRRALPAGSTWDPGSGTFYWQPAAGFLGRYRLVFSNGFETISVRVFVVPAGARE